MKTILALLLILAPLAPAATGDFLFQKKTATGYEPVLLTPETGKVITWSGGAPLNLDISATYQTIIPTGGLALNKLAQSSATINQVIAWNGSTWSPANASGGNLTSGPVTSSGGVSSIANGAITNAMLANSAVANLSGANTGDETPATIATDMGAFTTAQATTAANGLRLRKPDLVAFIGDSITDQNTATTITGLGWKYPSSYADGIGTWAKAILRNRFEFLNRSELFGKGDFGYSGYTISTLRGVTAGDSTARSAAVVMGSNSPLSQLISRIQGKNCIIVELIGTNDVLGYTVSVTAAQVAARRSALWQEYANCGIPASRIVALAIPPYINTPGTSFADEINAISAADAASRGITWVPYPAAMKTSGAPTAGYFRDAIHPNWIGAQSYGAAVATALDPLISSDPYPLPQATGFYTDPAWLTNNPFATGSVSVSGTRFSGNLATSWSVLFGGPGVNNNWALSKFTDSEGEWQRIVATGSDRDGDASLAISQIASVPQKTKVRVIARVRATGFSFYNIAAYFSGGPFAHSMKQNTSTVGNNPNNLGAFDGILVSPVSEIPFVAEGGTLEAWISLKGQGTIDIRAVGIIVVKEDLGDSTVPLPARSVVGTSTNDNAAAGYVGQSVTATVATGAAVSLTNNTATNITSVSLTDGDWDVEAQLTFKLAGATVTDLAAGINDTSVTIPTNGTEAFSGLQTNTATLNQTVTITRIRVSKRNFSNVPYYLVGRANFSAGTVTGYGHITARRVR